MSARSQDPLGVFIEGWGRLAAQWGLGKVMGEIHALLYLSGRPLSLEEMSERLRISRSNISLNVRGLQDLGVVRKATVSGDRKDYYVAEEDVVIVARRLAAEKKKRELDPALEVVDNVIRAAQIGLSDGDSPVDTHRLDKLKVLIEGISTIFDSFIEGSSSDKPEESVKTHA